MKITQISTRAWPYHAGLEEFLYTLSKQLVSSGNDITLLATNSSGEYSAPQIRLGRLPINRKQESYPSGISQINDVFRIHRAKIYLRVGPFHLTESLWHQLAKDSDTLHLHSMTDLPFWFPIIQRAKNKKLVLTIHDVAPSVANKTEITFWEPYTKLLVPELLKKFHWIIVPSLAQIEFLKSKGCEHKRVSLIPLCYDEQVKKVKDEGDNRQATRYRYGVEPDDFLIISVGRLIPVKRFDLLLRALSSVTKNPGLCPIRCLIIGPDEGSLTQLVRLSEQLGISNRVHFLGIRTHMETLRLIKAADLFVMPSADEAFNLSTVESMALSVPVLVSTGVGVSYLIRNNENGATFKRNDLEDLTEALSHLVKNRDRLRLLAFEGKKTADSCCSPEAVSKKYLEVYKRLAA